MDFRRFVKLFIPKRLFSKIEPLGHLVEAVVFNCIYGFPARGIKIIGVTGTNGKTTTCFLTYQMLSEAGYKVGLMSTVAYGVGKDIKPQIQHMTNVSMPELMRRLKWMRSKKPDWIVLETTSHALAQNRVWGIPYSIAVMTNVTHEHLDFHKTFTNYLNAKRKLFKITNKNRRGLRIGIINADDPNQKLFASDIQNPITYGLKNGDLKASDVELKTSGVSYKVKTDDQLYHIKFHLPGSFNVYNSLAVVAIGRALKLTKTQIETGIAALKSVEGRMTQINEGQNFKVIVDFAHTPDSFEKLFKDIRPIVKGKLMVVFGSAGRRDHDKRAIQGRLAGKYCDVIVVTEEDDRDEDASEILNQIAKGAEESGKLIDKNLFLIYDRTEAIQFAVDQADKDDVILLLGKGHEKTMERADGEIRWDEIGTAHKAVRLRLSKKS